MLQNKIERLLDVSPEEYVTEDLASPFDEQNITSALTIILKARLWKLSQRKLFDRTAARRLKPLSCKVNAFEESLGSQVILDQGHLSNKEPSIANISRGSRGMLDEGYCSQEVSLRAAGEDEHLLFEEGKSFTLDEESWESDLLFGKEEVGVDDDRFDDEEREMNDDLFWEALDTPKETHLGKDVFDNGKSPTTDDLGYSGVELLDDLQDDTQGGLYANIQNHAEDTLYPNIDAELLDDHVHHLSNLTKELVNSPQRGDYTHFYSRADLIGDEDMLLTT